MAKLTRPEIEEYLKKSDLVIWPVGSTEQHGVHLPLDNDAHASLETAKRLAERTGVLVAPVMPFGFSPHHMNFKGSVTLSFETLLAVYREVIESLLHHGFKKIVVMNGHGGNVNTINEALRQIRAETGVTVYHIPCWNTAGGFGAEALSVLKQEGGGHACESETSQALYLKQRVLTDKWEKMKPAKQTAFQKKWGRKFSAPRTFDEITANGCLGDAPLSSEEKGKALVEAYLKDAAEFIEDLKKLK